MSDTKHTPGPWKTGTVEMNEQLGRYLQPIFSGDRGYIIAWAGGEVGDAWGDEDRANAHLMISAIDLLGACRFALFTIEHREGLSHRKDLFTDDERNKLREAIAKAEGE